jgi:hypothetical protein
VLIKTKNKPNHLLRTTPSFNHNASDPTPNQIPNKRKKSYIEAVILFIGDTLCEVVFILL